MLYFEDSTGVNVCQQKILSDHPTRCSAGFGDKKGGTAVHDAGGLLRGLSALKEGVRLVEDDGQDLLIAAGAAVHMLLCSSETLPNSNVLVISEQ